jgi:NAD(P)-dependent dehydrogenase (short-subunit alcohol dehydrogenase family)
VITGPTSGIGYRTALELAAHGTVVLVGRNADKLAAVQREIGDGGGSATSVIADFADILSARHAASEIAALGFPIVERAVLEHNHNHMIECVVLALRLHHGPFRLPSPAGHTFACAGPQCSSSPAYCLLVWDAGAARKLSPSFRAHHGRCRYTSPPPGDVPADSRRSGAPSVWSVVDAERPPLSVIEDGEMSVKCTSD